MTRGICLRKKERLQIVLIVMAIAGLAVFTHSLAAAPPDLVEAGEYGVLVTLDDAISRALKSQAEMKQAFARLRQEESLYKGSLSEFLPKLEGDLYQALATGERKSVTYIDAGLRQPIFQGGKILAGKRKHKARLEGEKLKVEEVRLDIELGIRVLYAELLKERELTRIAQGEVKELTVEYERVKSLTEKEILPRYEFFRMETLLQSAKLALVKHKETSDYLFTVLKETIGIGEGESLDLEPVREFPELGTDISVYLETARQHDPVYKSGEYQIKEKGFEKRELQADRFPHLNLTAKWNRFRDVFADTNRMMVGIEGTWNIWDFGRLGNAIDAKTHEIEAVQYENEIQVREHEKKLRKLFHEGRAAREKVRMTEALVRERQEIYKNEKTRLIAGEKGTLELVDSFLALEEAKITRLEAITEYRVVLAKLERMTAFQIVPDQYEDQEEYESESGGARE